MLLMEPVVYAPSTFVYLLMGIFLLRGGRSLRSVVVSALQGQVRELQSKLAELSSARGGGSSAGAAGAPGPAPVRGAGVQGGDSRGRQKQSEREELSEETVRKDRSRSRQKDQKKSGAVHGPDADEAMQEGLDGGPRPGDHEAQIKSAQELAEGAEGLHL